jgi:hypothetical protein
MSSKSSDIRSSDIASAHYNAPESKDIHGLNSQSKCAVVSFIVVGVAGVVIMVLSGLNIFGSVGTTPGFIASIGGGGVLVCIAISSVVAIAVTNCKNHRQSVQPKQNNDELLGIQAQTRLAAPPKSKEKRKYDERREQFCSAAKKLLEERTSKIPIELPTDQEPGFRKKEEDAFYHFHHPRNTQFIKTFGGGEHLCVTTNKIPGVIFKQAQTDGKDMTPYVKRAEKARTICNNNNLYLLYVPKCKVVDFKPSVVMQEKLELLDGGLEKSQKACYQWAVHEPQLQPYIKELFRQLILFICLTNIADIKYNNIPFMKDGRIALFDLDENGAITGLAAGSARGKDGLFNMIPLEWLDEFIEIAKQHLKDEDLANLQECLPKLREKAQKRSERTKKISAFYNNHHIILPTQPLVFHKELFNGDEPKVVRFAEIAIQHFNREIRSLSLLSMRVGRKISIKANTEDKFYKDISEKDYQDLQKILEKGLSALKAKGYILSYKNYQQRHFFSVVC